MKKLVFTPAHIAEFLEFIHSKPADKPINQYSYSYCVVGDWTARKSRAKRHSPRHRKYVLNFINYLLRSHEPLNEIISSSSYMYYGELQQVLNDNKITHYPYIGPNQLKWITNLRSGEYPQSKNQLQNGCGFCCLGVAAITFNDLLDRSSFNSNGELNGGALGGRYLIVSSKLKLRGEDGNFITDSYKLVGLPDAPDNEKEISCLVQLNDYLEWSFEQIAEFIINNPRSVFTEPN